MGRIKAEKALGALMHANVSTGEMECERGAEWSAELPLGVWKGVCSYLNLEDKRSVRQIAHIFRDAADESVNKADIQVKGPGNLGSLAAALVVRCLSKAHRSCILQIVL